MSRMSASCPWLSYGLLARHVASDFSPRLQPPPHSRAIIGRDSVIQSGWRREAVESEIDMAGLRKNPVERIDFVGNHFSPTECSLGCSSSDPRSPRRSGAPPAGRSRASHTIVQRIAVLALAEFQSSGRTALVDALL